jgi:hypothetical protein
MPTVSIVSKEESRMREAINRWSCKVSGRRGVAVVIKQPSELQALPRLSDHILPQATPILGSSR